MEKKMDIGDRSGFVPHRLKQPMDEFWPDYVPEGHLLHMHGAEEDCNIRCCVVVSMDGLIEEPEESDKKTC